MKTPKPVTKSVVCSECGLPWGDHVRRVWVAESVTLADCVALLKAELAKPRPNPFGSSRVGAGVVNPMYPVSR